MTLVSSSYIDWSHDVFKIHVSQSVLIVETARVCPLLQWSPIFLTSGTGFMGDNFSTDLGRGMVLGLFKCITFIMHFLSIIITSAPPQIMRD